MANNIKRRAMSLQLGDIISSGNQPGSRLSYLPTVSMVEGQKMEKGIQGLGCQRQRVSDLARPYIPCRECMISNAISLHFDGEARLLRREVIPVFCAHGIEEMIMQVVNIFEHPVFQIS